YAAHVLGVQLVPPPHTLGVPPPPHVCGGGHDPQLVVSPPHPSGCGPHLPGYAAHVAGVHGVVDVPHTPGVPPPPHAAGAVQLPQLTVRPPHPSDCGPHVPG